MLFGSRLPSRVATRCKEAAPLLAASRVWHRRVDDALVELPESARQGEIRAAGRVRVAVHALASTFAAWRMGWRC